MNNGLINRAAVRRFVLDEAKRTGRDGVITQVSESVYYDLAAMVQQRIRALVHRHPSGFKTLE